LQFQQNARGVLGFLLPSSTRIGSQRLALYIIGVLALGNLRIMKKSGSLIGWALSMRSPGRRIQSYRRKKGS
jgi:hypothetical protein